MSTYSPVDPCSSTGRSPASASRSATRRVVRRSALAGSGCACRSRRNAISSVSCRARNASRASVRSSPMPTIPAEDKFVLRELGDERVYHAGQVAFTGVHRPLPFIGGTELEHLGNDGELFSTADPPCYRLKVTHKLINLVPQRGNRSRLTGHDIRVEPVPGRAPLVV